MNGLQDRAAGGIRASSGRWLTLTMALGLATLAAVPARSQADGRGIGTLTGHITLSTRMRGVPIGTAAYAPRGVTTQAPPASPEMRSVVVYLKDVHYTGALTPMHAEIRQVQETFVPRILTVTRGSTIDFPNADPYFHNVFSLSGASTFDLGRYPDGQSRTRQFTRAGLVKVYCHIHSQMSASILVLDHPYFVTPDADGSFTLPRVPAGTYTVTAWHERVGEQTTRVTIGNGGTTDVHLSLPLEDAR